MGIKDAIAELTEQVDILCDRHDSVVRAKKMPAKIDAPAPNDGTRHIEIRLRGSDLRHQSERIEALHAMLHLALSSRGLEGLLTKQPPENTNGRFQQAVETMTIPADRVEEVAGDIHKLAHTLATTPDLHDQYRKAARLVERHLHHPKVSGVHTMIYPKMSSEKMFFKLVVLGMPNAWAMQVAGILGYRCIIEEVSGNRLVEGKTYTGNGKSVSIPMDHSRIDEAFDTIEALASAQPEQPSPQTNRGRRSSRAAVLSR